MAVLLSCLLDIDMSTGFLMLYKSGVRANVDDAVISVETLHWTWVSSSFGSHGYSICIPGLLLYTSFLELAMLIHSYMSLTRYW